MKSINECIGQELRWVHPHLRRREYELRAGDEVLVGVSYKGALSSQVRAETGAGLWLFESKGLLQAITILALEAHTELASVKRGMNGQVTLLFPMGASTGGSLAASGTMSGFGSTTRTRPYSI